VSASVKVRCTRCDVIYDVQTPHTTEPTCPTWQAVIVSDDAEGVAEEFQHRSGVAIFAHEDAARLGLPAPSWASEAVPADSALGRQAQLEQRAADALAANAAFLADANVTNAEAVAQLKALTRQVSALIRLRRGDFSAVD
jgi:hypothetical protein